MRREFQQWLTPHSWFSKSVQVWKLKILHPDFPGTAMPGSQESWSPHFSILEHKRILTNWFDMPEHRGHVPWGELSPFELCRSFWILCHKTKGHFDTGRNFPDSCKEMYQVLFSKVFIALELGLCLWKCLSLSHPLFNLVCLSSVTITCQDRSGSPQSWVCKCTFTPNCAMDFTAHLWHSLPKS